MTCDLHGTRHWRDSWGCGGLLNLIGSLIVFDWLATDRFHPIARKMTKCEFDHDSEDKCHAYPESINHLFKINQSTDPIHTSIAFIYETSGSSIFTAFACVAIVNSVVMDNETRAGAASTSNQKENQLITTMRPGHGIRYYKWESRILTRWKISLHHVMHNFTFDKNTAHDTRPDTGGVLTCKYCCGIASSNLWRKSRLTITVSRGDLLQVHIRHSNLHISHNILLVVISI